MCVAPSSGNRYRIDDTDSEDDAVDGGDTILEEEESDDEVAVRRKPKRVRPIMYILNERTCKAWCKFSLYVQGDWLKLVSPVQHLEWVCYVLCNAEPAITSYSHKA